MVVVEEEEEEDGDRRFEKVMARRPRRGRGIGSNPDGGREGTRSGARSRRRRDDVRDDRSLAFVQVRGEERSGGGPR